jgi:hypothetical protein
MVSTSVEELQRFIFPHDLVENEIFFIVGLKNLRVDINILSGHGC